MVLFDVNNFAVKRILFVTHWIESGLWPRTNKSQKTTRNNCKSQNKGNKSPDQTHDNTISVRRSILVQHPYRHHLEGSKLFQTSSGQTDHWALSTRTKTIFSQLFFWAAFQEGTTCSRPIRGESDLILHQKKKKTRRSMRMKSARCIQTYSPGGETE